MPQHWCLGGTGRGRGPRRRTVSRRRSWTGRRRLGWEELLSACACGVELSFVCLFDVDVGRLLVFRAGLGWSRVFFFLSCSFLFSASPFHIFVYVAAHRIAVRAGPWTVGGFGRFFLLVHAITISALQVPTKPHRLPVAGINGKHCAGLFCSDCFRWRHDMGFREFPFFLRASDRCKHISFSLVLVLWLVYPNLHMYGMT